MKIATNESLEAVQLQRFERNRIGRDFAVGDIHGCFTALQIALDAIGFSPETDRLFCAGDLVDRGPGSHLVVDPRWPGQIPPPLATPNSPRQDDQIMTTRV